MAAPRRTPVDAARDEMHTFLEDFEANVRKQFDIAFDHLGALFDAMDAEKTAAPAVPATPPPAPAARRPGRPPSAVPATPPPAAAPRGRGRPPSAAPATAPRGRGRPPATPPPAEEFTDDLEEPYEDDTAGAPGDALDMENWDADFPADEEPAAAPVATARRPRR